MRELRVENQTSGLFSSITSSFLSLVLDAQTNPASPVTHVLVYLRLYLIHGLFFDYLLLTEASYRRNEFYLNHHRARPSK
jgi:hypothetical protein